MPYVKVRCPQWRLEEVAEHIKLKLRNRDGSVKRFKVSRRDTFIGMGSGMGSGIGSGVSGIGEGVSGGPGEGGSALFRSSERQQIIDYIIRSKIKDGGAELGEDTSLGQQITQRFPLHMTARLDEIKHSWVTFWREEQVCLGLNLTLKCLKWS